MKFIIWDTIQQCWKQAEHVNWGTDNTEKCIRFKRAEEIHGATKFSWDEVTFFGLYLFPNYVLIQSPF